MAKAAFDPTFNFCVRQVRPRVLEIGTHGFGQSLDGNIGGLGFVSNSEISQNVTDGASGRMRRSVCHLPRLPTHRLQSQYSRAPLSPTVSIPQISAIFADLVAQLYP